VAYDGGDDVACDRDDDGAACGSDHVAYHIAYDFRNIHPLQIQCKGSGIDDRLYVCLLL